MKFSPTLVLLLSITAVIQGQDCKVRGIKCADHEQCCGGCCFDGVCIDTYRSCLSPFDVCKDHACRGEETCFVYQPPACPGCEPLPLCRLEQP